MTADELKAIRQEIGFDKRSFALLLGWPYPTLRDRERGDRGIGEDDARQVRDAYTRQKEIMRKLDRKRDARIAREYPYGIPSDPVN